MPSPSTEGFQGDEYDIQDVSVPPLSSVPVTVAWQSWKLSAQELFDLQLVVKSNMAFFALGLF